MKAFSRQEIIEFIHCLEISEHLRSPQVFSGVPVAQS